MTVEVQECPCQPGGDVLFHDILPGQHEDLDIVIDPDKDFNDGDYQAYYNNPQPDLTPEIVIKNSLAYAPGGGRNTDTIKTIVLELLPFHQEKKDFQPWPLTSESEVGKA